MNVHQDAVKALAAAGFVGVDLDSPAYPDFVATNLSSRYRTSYNVGDTYVEEVVDYSRRPEVIDEAVDLIGGFGREIGRRHLNKDLAFDVDPLKEDLKRTFGRKYNH